LDGLAPGSFDYTVFDGYTVATATVHITFQSYYDYHNYNIPNDVDGDGLVSPNDVITVINFINAHGGSTTIGKIHSASSPKGFVDVVADNTIAANDVVSVVNYINARPRGTSLSTAQGAASDANAADASLSPAAVDAYLLSTTLDSGLTAKKK